MKFLLTVAAIIAVATAVPTQRGLISPVLAGPIPVVDENNQPISIGPAILDFEPVAIGPAIVDSFEPIQVGPAIVDTFEPVSIGPAIVDFPVAPSPVIIGPSVPSQPATLVQLIVNVNSAPSGPIAPAPVAIPEVEPTPVIVVEQPQVQPEPVVIPEPVIIPEPGVIPEPVIVIDQEPIIEPILVVNPITVEPVNVGTPIIPAPAVVLPDTLN